jgi:PAS domain S-box-containing protein
MAALNKKGKIFGNSWLTLYLALLLIVVGAGWALTGYLEDKARQEIVEYNDNALLLHIAHLTGEFNKIERAVRILSESPSIISALVSLNEPDTATANSTLDRYNLNLDTSVCYLMNAKGMTIASTNRNNSDSFVGKSYQFRPYFTQAIKGIPGRYFALGATSLKRGFYASYPVIGKSSIIGVAVIKQDVDSEESHLTKYPYCFIVDPNGIVFLTGKNEMKLKSLWPLSPETQAALLKSKQFGEKEFVPVFSQEIEDGMEIEFEGANYLVSRKVFNPEGWSVVLMTKTDRIFMYKSAGIIITVLMVTVIMILLLINYNTYRSSEKVRASEEKLRFLTDKMTDIIWTTDRNLSTTYVSPSIEKVLGFTPEERKKQSLEELMTPESLEKAQKILLEELQREPGNLLDQDRHLLVEIEYYRKDGSTCWMENGVKVVRDLSGQIEMIHGVSRDISERRNAEEALKDRERTLSTLISNLPGFVYRCANDRDWTMIFISDGCRKVTGYEPNDFIGNNTLSYNDIVHPDSRETLWKKWQVQLAIKEPFVDEYPIINKDGKIHWVWERGVGVYSENGELLFLEGFITDITERKRSGDELSNSFKLLRAALGGTIQALAVAVETRDPYTAGHQKNVADLSRAIANEMRLDNNLIDGIRMAAAIHDLGKMGIPAEILSKPSRLSEVEFKLIKTHSQAGYDILKDIEFPWPIAQIVLQHHERLDGSGYPNGLKGNEILPEARIIAVADVVDAIAANRPYRPAHGIEKAFDEITKNKGVLYDPEVVEACLRLFKEKGYKFQ